MRSEKKRISSGLDSKVSGDDKIKLDKTKVALVCALFELTRCLVLRIDNSREKMTASSLPRTPDLDSSSDQRTALCPFCLHTRRTEPSKVAALLLLFLNIDYHRRNLMYEGQIHVNGSDV